MIARTIANSFKPVVRYQMPKIPAKAMAEVAEKAAKQAAYVVPTESTWYQIKKKIINFASNIDVGKAQVHAVTEDMAAKAQAKVKPGDILIRRTEGTSGNWFIPSWWKHAGVYVGKGEVVEATFKGIHKTPFKNFMTDGDHVMIIRAKNLNASQSQSIVNYANHQIGRPYDFDFNFSDEARQSCTELANNAVKAGAGKELVQKNWIGSVTGDAFKNENFKLVWTSTAKKAKWNF